MIKEFPICAIDIQNELDIMLSHKRGIQFSKYCGITLSEQTRFATAISELCRNVVEYAKKGTISFSVVGEDEQYALVATIADKGSGIKDVDKILQRNSEGFRGRGLGIVFARKLSDSFKIDSSIKGTQVRISKDVPPGKAVINNLVIQGWIKHLENEPAISPYEELKSRNIQLLELTDELSAKALMVERQFEEIKLLNKQLSSSNQHMKEFTYAISHDLKTPLSSLNMAAEYLAQHPKARDRVVYRDIMNRSVKRLDKTVRSLIEILDLQNPEKRIVRNLRFEDIFKIVREEHQQYIKEANASIDTHFEKASDIVYVEGYLQSVMHNLLSNAIKYRDPSRRLSIQIQTVASRDGIRLVFSDNGTGMDMKKIGEKLFAPFNRFSSTENGKGIGLYLIKGMVESNGGRVEVSSTPDYGTTFSFTLVPYQQ